MQTRSNDNIAGIDVSRYQGNIDWLKVAADKQAIKFAYVKATEGIGYIDPLFRRNAVGAPAVGLKVGFYHYARPETGNSAAAEAAAFCEAIAGLPSDLPHVLDVEGAAEDLGPTMLTQWVLHWLGEVERRTGKRVMIYSGAYFARSYLGVALAGYPLWVAHYGADTPMSNGTWGEWSVFQYSETGKVGGISGGVDMNEMDLEFWNEITAPEPAQEDEDDMSKPLVFENDWQWTKLGGALDGLYHKGAISDYTWAEKAYTRQLTGAELSWLNMIIAARQQGVEV